VVAGDTATVKLTVLGIEHVAAAGRLVALAAVALEIAGIEVVLLGVRIVRERGGRLGVEAPVFRHRGEAHAAVDLPDELRAAIAEAVLSHYMTPPPPPGARL
jgi:stage V sporulation protein G